MLLFKTQLPKSINTVSKKFPRGSTNACITPLYKYVTVIKYDYCTRNQRDKSTKTTINSWTQFQVQLQIRFYKTTIYIHTNCRRSKSRKSYTRDKDDKLYNLLHNVQYVYLHLSLFFE